ncbi:N-6 DNA methylase [Clostridium sp. 'deep sea']|uniref:N-6 DNA methylase n=1 Tax=Clostridium sp. 'deep sea' TaxID=2779445 RepID=UPI0018969DB7|nr:N-6 DNA methylase [Clostridium sp. 'deep sea']QOR33860.1 N-6 DNA methylase [Clostridium sp. 'deep sea']
MDIKQWIIKKVENFNDKIKSEEDLKLKVVIPYLKYLGYDENNIRYENPIEVIIGSRKTKVFSDIEILINGKTELVIDTKKPSKSISEKDILQSASYAKLVSTPSALYSATTNGVDCVVSNIFTGARFNEIPSKAQLLRDIAHTKKINYKEVELREIKSVLFTLLEPEELYRVIKRCKDVIEKKGLIRSDQSFKEMTKILLVKMNEERRVKVGEGSNRFTLDYIDVNTKKNKIDVISVFNKLFNSAKIKYKEIYTKEDENLLIFDNDCLLEVIKNLEPFSFLGTGDDIKGAVYEIFLKSTLRGDFDQYFTPREIVDFIIRIADPEPGKVFLDPACGSGGFLIQAFNYVNQKIVNSPFSEVESKKKFNDLINKSIWGHEADYDLHVLAKINMIMHGDGWNNIHQGDTLTSDKLPNDHFDFIFTNPPFTIKYDFNSVLSKYELGLGKESEELDILFFEKSINLLKPGGDLYIVLPEGLLNNKAYGYFREWLLKKTHLICSISLPEGAFIPFGGSVSKTCIIGVRKKDKAKLDFNTPNYVYLGSAKEVGYETGKKNYKHSEKNDLAVILDESKAVFENVKLTSNKGECGWIEQSQISSYRLDANYLLNMIDRSQLKKDFDNLVPLKNVCYVDNISIKIVQDIEYNYIEVPDISSNTGTVSNVRCVLGSKIKADSLHRFFTDDILITRINPRKSRVTIAPPINGIGVISKEVYRIALKKNNGFIDESNRFILVALLQSDRVKNQIIRLATGSSSSRARVQVEDLLNNVYLPIPPILMQKEISDSTYRLIREYWSISQKLLLGFTKNHIKLGSNKCIKDMRSV